jgi:uncharacterized membrane protein YhaH (DUF805 family)
MWHHLPLLQLTFGSVTKGSNDHGLQSSKNSREITMSNPYAAPDAVLSDVGEDETYEPQIFSVNGRIGRLRYLAYSWLLGFILMFVIGIVAAVLLPVLVKKGSHGPGMLFMILLYAPVIAVALVMAKRRFNDLNLSGWLSPLILVPFLNILVGLYLLFAPGTKGANNHGPQPTKNSTILVIVGVVGPIFMIAIIGILAAIAIPAYQSYVMRAKAAAAQQHLQQQQQQQPSQSQ